MLGYFLSLNVFFLEITLSKKVLLSCAISAESFELTKWNVGA